MSADQVAQPAGEYPAAITAPPGTMPPTEPKKKDNIIKRLINKIRLILRGKNTATRPPLTARAPVSVGSNPHGETEQPSTGQNAAVVAGTAS